MIKNTSQFKPLFFNNSTSFWDVQPFESNIATIYEQILQVKANNQYSNVFIKVKQQYLIMVSGDKYNSSNIENSLIYKITDGQKEIGLKLIKGSSSFEIFGDIGELFTVLKKYCIQTDFVLKYKVIKLMAKGTFANVFLAENVKSKELLAVKCFDKKVISSTPKDLKSLSQELKILRLMKQKQVLGLIETFETVSYVFLVYEYLKGGDLHDYISRSGQLSERKVNFIMQQLVNGLSFVHSQGIIHRDIKPDNIILRNKDNIEDIVISDFGLADFYNFDCNYLYPQCGTPGFVAPEILLGVPYDYKVDVYSLGVLFYIMISGRRPSNGKRQEQIFSLNEKGEINFQNLHLSADGINLLKKMLEINPEHRYSLNMVKQHIWFKKYAIPFLKPQLSLQHICLSEQPNGNTTPRLVVSKMSNPAKNLKTEQQQNTERKHHRQFGAGFNLSLGNFTQISSIYY